MAAVPKIATYRHTTEDVLSYTRNRVQIRGLVNFIEAFLEGIAAPGVAQIPSVTKWSAYLTINQRTDESFPISDAFVFYWHYNNFMNYDQF